MASDRVEVDTARPFRSVKEAVAVFGELILVGDGRSSKLNGNANAAAAIVMSNAMHEASSGSSGATLPPDIMEADRAEEDDDPPAVVPMYSAPSSPPSQPSPNEEADDERGGEDEEAAAGVMVMRSVKKLEADVAETRQEVAQLKKRGAEMEMAVESLNAQLQRGLSKLGEMEDDRTAASRRSVGGDTDLTVGTFRSERWGWGGDKATGASSGTYEYLPSFSHALSLGEVDDGELVGGRRRKASKVKPIIPLIGDIIFSKKKSTKDKGDGFYSSGDLYSVLG
ncbi:hypothetical protein GUJ93_ZPchr0011g28158 [Zizania palustris]|uniref:WEB family protein n=1 Tax=Zizania palustris TaxID=103762 RepID=A0A8J5WK70_ZIZPA|nr:hypothetical protein GUJ93_ZPchr0011g28158 [Zizania palustris]